jgi:hypothetical protein
MVAGTVRGSWHRIPPRWSEAEAIGRTRIGSSRPGRTMVSGISTVVSTGMVGSPAMVDGSGIIGMVLIDARPRFCDVRSWRTEVSARIGEWQDPDILSSLKRTSESFFRTAIISTVGFCLVPIKKNLVVGSEDGWLL